MCSRFLYFINIVSQANPSTEQAKPFKKFFSCGIRLAPVLKTIFINVSYHILVASLTLMALF